MPYPRTIAPTRSRRTELRRAEERRNREERERRDRTRRLINEFLGGYSVEPPDEPLIFEEEPGYYETDTITKRMNSTGRPSNKEYNEKLGMIMGIEIELEYNNKLLTLYPRGYHSSNASYLGKLFRVGTDASLNCQKFRNTAEIVSYPVYNYEFFDTLKQFKKEIYLRVAEKTKRSYRSALQKYKLSDIMNFNDSTGSHVHMTPIVMSKNHFVLSEFKQADLNVQGYQIPLKNFLNYNLVLKFRNTLKEKVKKEMPHIYNMWSERLIRNYADDMKDHGWGTYRKCEFNISNSNFSKGRIEYRSMHLYGIENWKDFFLIWTLFAKTVEEVIISELKKPRQFTEKKSMTFKKEFVHPLKKEHNLTLDYDPENWRQEVVEKRVGFFEDNFESEREIEVRI